MMAELCSYNRDSMACKSRYFLSGPLRKFANACKENVLNEALNCTKLVYHTIAACVKG